MSPEICRLTALARLWLNNNQLVALPPEIGRLIDLEVLSLGNNRLAGNTSDGTAPQYRSDILDWEFHSVYPHVKEAAI